MSNRKKELLKSEIKKVLKEANEFLHTTDARIVSAKIYRAYYRYYEFDCICVSGDRKVRVYLYANVKNRRKSFVAGAFDGNEKECDIVYEKVELTEYEKDLVIKECENEYSVHDCIVVYHEYIKNTAPKIQIYECIVQSETYTMRIYLKIDLENRDKSIAFCL